MKLRVLTLLLGVLLAMSVGCNKQNSQATGNPPAQGTDNSATQGADNSSAQPSSPGASEASRAPVTLTIPAGKVITVRLADAVGSKISQPGQSFGGSLARPVEVDGEVAIPEGTRVEGEVVDAKPLGHFAGGALLQLRLNSIRVNGESMPVQTATFTQTLKGKGKRTAIIGGGGAGLGAIIGGLAGGGKGAAVGALAGGGAGTAGGALTGNKEIVLPAESAVAFTLRESLRVRK